MATMHAAPHRQHGSGSKAPPAPHPAKGTNVSLDPSADGPPVGAPRPVTTGPGGRGGQGAQGGQGGQGPEPNISPGEAVRKHQDAATGADDHVKGEA